MNWEEAVVRVGEEVSIKHETERRTYQVIGEIALDIINSYGHKALKEFADEVKETYGTGYSHHTYKNYATIVHKLKGINIPEDFSSRALITIASTDNPQEWINKAVEEGLSGNQIINLIRESKGLTKKDRLCKCPECGYEFSY